MSNLHITPNYLAPILVVEFDFESTQSVLFDAWTNLDIFKKWFFPTGFTVSKAELVLEVGGCFTIHMQSPEGEIYPTRGEYILLEKPDRIVYKDSWDDARENNEPVVVEIVFEEKGTGTTLKIYSSFVSVQQKEEILKSGVSDGWEMFFGNLQTVLTNK